MFLEGTLTAIVQDFLNTITCLRMLSRHCDTLWVWFWAEHDFELV